MGSDNPGHPRLPLPPDHLRVLIERAQAEPARTMELAGEILRTRASDPRTRSTAWRARGLAHHATGDPTQAQHSLRNAVRIAVRHHRPVEAALARMSLGLVLLWQGRSLAALTQIDRSLESLSGPARGSALMQRGVVLQRLGRLEDALAEYRAADRLLARNDHNTRARLCSNRAVVLASLGHLRTAENDLYAAQRHQASVSDVPWSSITQNLGWVIGRAGRYPEALEWMDQAEQQLRDRHAPLAPLYRDRAEMLLAVGLLDDARASIRLAINEFENRGLFADLAESLLLYAEIETAAQRPHEAEAAARRAEQQFGTQDRPVWQAEAQVGALRLALLTANGSCAVENIATELLRTATHLWSIGRRHCAADGLLAAAARLPAVCAEMPGPLDSLRAVRNRQTAPLPLRVRAWHAEALTQRAHKNGAGMQKALLQGMELIDTHRLALGSTELRASAGAHIAALAGLAITDAVDTGDPAMALMWVERNRPTVGTQRFDHVPGVSREELLEYRSLSASAQMQPEQVSVAQLQRVCELENTIRAASHRTLRSGPGLRSRGGPPELLAHHLGQLQQELDHRSMASMFVTSEQLWAVVVDADSIRLVEVCALAELRACVDLIAYLLRRAIAGRADTALWNSLSAKLHSIDAMVVQPLKLNSDACVVVPARGLDIPWGAIPSLAARPVHLAPSVRQWRKSALAVRRSNREVYVAGPGTTHGNTEVQALKARYPDAEVLNSPTVSEVLTAADGADLLHLAAHGTFRNDNPMFSAIALADGPLTLYDLECLRRAPRRVVLSACDVGNLATVGHPDAIPLGMCSAFLTLGTQEVLASAFPLADDAALALMGELHANLASAASLAHALVRVRSAMADCGDRRVAASAMALLVHGASPARTGPSRYAARS